MRITTDPGTISRIRAASVVLPLLLRPATASTAGTAPVRSPPDHRIDDRAKQFHAPRSGFGLFRGQLLQGHVPIMALGPAWDAMSYQIRSLVSDPDDTDADLPGPGAAPSGSRAAW